MTVIRINELSNGKFTVTDIRHSCLNPKTLKISSRPEWFTPAKNKYFDNFDLAEWAAKKYNEIQEKRER